ncbi:MAG: transaldolase [Acidobacteriota bacterium]
MIRQSNTRVANPLVELQNLGQSVWCDNISREMLQTGELLRLIGDDGLRGVTSNPTIFEKAINGSNHYDDAIRSLVKSGAEVEAVYEALVTDDIQRGADLFLPAYRETQGQDGFISLEVSPKLARETEATIQEARRLWNRVNRPNLMIKVPATPEGLPAIEQLIGEGINVNVTLMFSMDHYVQVASAYLRGLRRLEQAGRPLTVSSVASFFVSRVDTVVDKLLEERMAKPGADSRRLEALLGKTAIANARLVYRRFREIFGGPEFQSLRAKGARVQRPLWASTSTKNPRYRDVLYAEELVGPDTVDTMPPATITAFRDHGKVRLSLEENLDDAEQVFAQLAEVGIDMKAVTGKLQDDGVRLFAESFDVLMKSLSEKRETLKRA